MDIVRYLDLERLVAAKSYFLFGPRQTGKSWLIRQTLKNHKLYNLLESETYLRLNHSPQLLREEWQSTDRIIIIDEIQKLPLLLDEVHLMIETHNVHFLLTGSSARKLKRSGVNLLGGRARVQHFHPLTFVELGRHFDLDRALMNGLLPSIYFSDRHDAELDLKAYVGTYLREEIAAEGLTRNVPAFSRFLEIAALSNGKIINYTNIANDAQVARTTVHEYFHILKETLIATELLPWQKTQKRKPLSVSKYYFFDTGVVRSLQNRKMIAPGTPEYGEIFETYICHELTAFLDYTGAGELRYWRSTSGFEVDFVVADLLAVELKASRTIGLHDLKGLRALQEESSSLKHYVLVCFESTLRHVEGITIMPWAIFLTRLWARDFL